MRTAPHLNTGSPQFGLPAKKPDWQRLGRVGALASKHGLAKMHQQVKRTMHGGDRQPSRIKTS
eukprot:219867-Prymnesium_polylepis.1